MSNEPIKSSMRILDPMDRVSEVDLPPSDRSGGNFLIAGGARPGMSAEPLVVVMEQCQNGSFAKAIGRSHRVEEAIPIKNSR